MSEERTNMAIRDLKHYVVDNMSLDVQDDFEIICKYIKDLQQKVEQLEKEVNEYQKELEKADSITQSCIFQGKKESEISFRNCLNRLEQLENIRKEAIKWVKLMGKYENGSCTRNFKLMSADFNYLLNILNKGSDKYVKESNTNNN